MTTKEFQERSDLRIFLSYFKPHKKLFVLDMVCALTIALIDLAFPYLPGSHDYYRLVSSCIRSVVGHPAKFGRLYGFGKAG